jgi:hypothetical protein
MDHRINVFCPLNPKFKFPGSGECGKIMAVIPFPGDRRLLMELYRENPGATHFFSCYQVL